MTGRQRLLEGAELKIITNRFMVRSEVVHRTWQERLFSWPWHPLRRWKSRLVPEERILRYGDTLVMHPEIFERLKREIESG